MFCKLFERQTSIPKTRKKRKASLLCYATLNCGRRKQQRKRSNFYNVNHSRSSNHRWIRHRHHHTPRAITATCSGIEININSNNNSMYQPMNCSLLLRTRSNWRRCKMESRIYAKWMHWASIRPKQVALERVQTVDLWYWGYVIAHWLYITHNWTLLNNWSLLYH